MEKETRMDKWMVIAGILEQFGDDIIETVLEKAFAPIPGEVLLASPDDPLTDADSIGNMEAKILDTFGASFFPTEGAYFRMSFGMMEGVYVVGVNMGDDLMSGQWEFYISVAQKERAMDLFGGVNFE